MKTHWLLRVCQAILLLVVITAPIAFWDASWGKPEGRVQTEWVSAHGGFLAWYAIYLVTVMMILGWRVKRNWDAADRRRGEIG